MFFFLFYFLVSIVAVKTVMKIIDSSIDDVSIFSTFTHTFTCTGKCSVYLDIHHSVLKNLFFYSTVNLLHSAHKKTLKKTTTSPNRFYA